MMLHQDGSTHRWLPALEQELDLIVTMDDATSEIYSAFLVDQEGTMSSFRALAEVIGAQGLPCALDTDRASHYFFTPKAGEKVARDQPTQVGRALAQLGIEHIAAYAPEARGRSERTFGTLQDRLPKELALAGIATVDAANRFIRTTYLPEHNARFGVPPEHPETAFVAAASWRCTPRPPLRSGGARGRQRQHRALPGPEPADPAEPDPAALRQGPGPRPRLPGRHARFLLRAALSGSLSGRRPRARP